MVEMTTLLPVDGGFVTYASRYIDESVGMALGWNYAITQWALICFELTSELWEGTSAGTKWTDNVCHDSSQCYRAILGPLHQSCHYDFRRSGSVIRI